MILFYSRARPVQRPFPIFRFFSTSTPTETPLQTEQQKKIQQMQEYYRFLSFAHFNIPYFSQYIEEYYEEDEPAEGETIPVKKVDDDRIQWVAFLIFPIILVLRLDSVDAVLQLLEQQRAQDIVVK